MRWTHLGHASWLVDAGPLRLLFDPLLEPTHHAGVFEVFPRRRIDVDALTANVIVVTHAHADHFDVPSLARLALADRDRVVLTADPRVADAARRLGFAWVRELPDDTWLTLEGVRLRTTRSHCAVVEWGMAVATDDGVVWNQVDSELGGPARVRQAVAALLGPLGRDRLDLVIARWHPVQQVAVALGQPLAFPRAAWARELACAAATDARHLVPGASGARYVGEASWLNRVAYPGSEARFLRDLVAAAPATVGHRSGPGRTWRLSAGALHVEPPHPAVTLLPCADDRALAPPEIPPLRDPDPRDPLALRDRIEAWVRGPLATATAARPDTLTLRVVLSDGDAAWTLAGGRVTPGLDPDADLRNDVVGSALLDVLDGLAPWGRPLLGGQLRAVDRRERPVGAPIFLYDAVSWDQAFARWVDGQLARWT